MKHTIVPFLQARKFGVRSAMPGFIGKRLCPSLVFAKPDFSKYSAASKWTRAVFKDFDPNFEAGSLDEAYLDITDYCHVHNMTSHQVSTLHNKCTWCPVCHA